MRKKKENKINEVKICSSVYNLLMKKIGKSSSNIPMIYMAGEDSKKVIRKIVKVKKVSNSGCREMPDLNTSELTKAYIGLVKDGYTPAGLVRLGNDYAYRGNWGEDSGPAVWQNIGYLITVGYDILKACMYFEKTGEIEPLSVLVTDK